MAFEDDGEPGYFKALDRSLKENIIVCPVSEMGGVREAKRDLFSKAARAQ